MSPKTQKPGTNTQNTDPFAPRQPDGESISNRENTGLLYALGVTAVGERFKQLTSESAVDIKDRIILGTALIGRSANLTASREADLQHLHKTKEVHKQVAKALINKGSSREKLTFGSNITDEMREERQLQKEKKWKDAQNAEKPLPPVTLSERRQSLRARRRQARANLERLDQMRRERIYVKKDELVTVKGKEGQPDFKQKVVKVVGQDGYSDMVKQERSEGRIGFFEARRQLKADHRARRGAMNMGRLSGLEEDKYPGQTSDSLIKKSAEGKDLPGRHFDKAINKTEKKLAKSQTRKEKLDRFIDAKKASIATRKDERAARPAPEKLTREQRRELLEARWELHNQQTLEHYLGSAAIAAPAEAEAIPIEALLATDEQPEAKNISKRKMVGQSARVHGDIAKAVLKHKVGQTKDKVRKLKGFRKK